MGWDGGGACVCRGRGMRPGRRCSRHWKGGGEELRGRAGLRWVEVEEGGGGWRAELVSPSCKLICGLAQMVGGGGICGVQPLPAPSHRGGALLMHCSSRRAAPDPATCPQSGIAQHPWLTPTLPHTLNQALLIHQN